MSIVEEFQELKPIIKEKWLNFYEENLSLFKNINLQITYGNLGRLYKI